MISEWQSSIAHPAMSEWVTVAAYLIAVLLSALAARKAEQRHQARECWLWRAIAILMTILAVNEPLDFQSLITIAGRANAHANGWYAERRIVQHVFIILSGGSIALAGFAILFAARRTHPAARLALVGIALIGLFVILRAASIHHFDEIFARMMTWFKWAPLDEMAGIIIVAVAAVLYILNPRTHLA